MFVVFVLVSSRKYPYPPQRKVNENSKGGRGNFKSPIFKEKYSNKVEFPKGMGVQAKKPSVEGYYGYFPEQHICSFSLSWHMTCLNSVGEKEKLLAQNENLLVWDNGTVLFRVLHYMYAWYWSLLNKHTSTSLWASFL